MDSITISHHNAQLNQEPKRDMSTMDVGEEEAIRKVEAATTPNLDAQSGVRNVEAVTLTWTKTSLVCAFAWFVLPRFHKLCQTNCTRYDSTSCTVFNSIMIS
jgi:hypothetical protein